MSARRLMAITLAVTLVGCGSSDNQPQWSDASDFSWLPVIDAVTVAEGDMWRFDIGLGPDDTGEPAAPCLQPVVVDQPLGCIPVDASDNRFGFTAVTRVDDQRVIWQADTINDQAPIDHFVIWSTASPNGRRLEPIVHRDVENLLWIMEPGEEPWGYQAIAPNGTLIRYSSHVGLPAD